MLFCILHTSSLFWFERFNFYFNGNFNLIGMKTKGRGVKHLRKSVAEKAGRVKIEQPDSDDDDDDSTATYDDWEETADELYSQRAKLKQGL